MKALSYLGRKEKKIVEKVKPRVENGKEAVVKLLKTTICGTDLHILSGDTPEVPIGLTLGHEVLVS